MANEENRSVNEVVLNGESIISTRKDTVAEDNLVRNESATDKAGKKIKGELDVASADDTYNINDPVDDIEDEDYIPFNDVSDVELPKKKTLFSTLIEKLTNYFLPAKSIGGKSQLKFNDSGVLDLQLNDIDASKTNNNVSSNHYATTSNVLDKAKRIIMRTEAVVNPNGQIGWKAYVRNYDTSGNEVGQKGMQFHMNKSGKLSYQIDDARAFREAIGTMDVIGTSLPSGTVIDDYHTSSHTGVYYFADDGVAGNITTLPEAICGKLIVANNGNGGFSQYYLPNHSVKLWVRVWWSNAWTSWTELISNANAENYLHYLSQPTRQITANQDLNNFTESGTYQCNNANIAVTLSNCPVSVSFKLVVDRQYGRSASEITQRITCQNATETVDWFRTKSYNSSTWGLWVHLPYIEDRTWGSNTGFQSSFIGTNGKKGVLHYNHVANHLVHNFNNGSTWDGEKTLANLDDIIPPTVGNGYAEATINGSTITATISGFKLVEGGIVSLYFPSEVHSNCTLNISNTGAKYIRLWSGGYVSYGSMLSSSMVHTFMYDGTYYRLISSAMTPTLSLQNYVADTSGNILIDWGYQNNRAQLKYGIGTNKLAWNYYKNSTWRGDVTVADYDDMNPAIAKVGKSILPSWSMTSNVYTNNGITYTFNPSTGEITANGTASNNSVCIIAGKDYSQYWIPKGTYTLSGCPSGGSGLTYRLILDLASGSKSDYGSGNTFTLTSDQKSTNNEHLYIRIESGQTVSNVVFKPMLRPAWTSADYEPCEDIYKGNCYVGTCTTAAGTKDKVAYVDGYFVLRKGVRVAIKFSNTNTYSSSTSNPVTLNVNGTGAKNIWYNTTHSGAGNTGTCSWVYGVANRYLYYVYDGTYWVWETCGEAMNSTNFLRNDASSTLTASDSAYLSVKSSNIDLTQANNGVENTKYPAYIIQDKNGRDMTRLETVVETNGQIRTFLQVCNYNTTSASHFRAGITMYTNKSQDMWYGLSNPHYFHRELGFGYGTCSTAADQRVKVVSMPRFRLVVGGIIGVKFSNTNTYSATADNKVCLNVNGTGEKPIYYGTGYPTGTHTTAFGYANKVHYYMYDGTNWVWLNHSQDNDDNNRKSFYGTCATAADQQIKVVSLADTNGWELRAGTIVGVRFSNTNTFSSQTATPVQLNVNNTGAKNIWYSTTHSGAGNTGTNTRIYGEANRVFTYMYDGTYWVWLNCGYEADTVNPKSLGFGYGTCDTAASTTAKVVTMADYTLRTGGYVSVKFTNGVPASATMNINSRGAKNIRYRGSNIGNYIIKGGDLATFIYNGSQYDLIGIDRDSSKQNNVIAWSNITFGTNVPSMSSTNSNVLGDIRSNVLYANMRLRTAASGTIPANNSSSGGFFMIANQIPNTWRMVHVTYGSTYVPAYLDKATYNNVTGIMVILRNSLSVANNADICVSFEVELE